MEHHMMEPNASDARGGAPPAMFDKGGLEQAALDSSAPDHADVKAGREVFSARPQQCATPASSSSRGTATEPEGQREREEQEVAPMQQPGTAQQPGPSMDHLSPRGATAGARATTSAEQAGSPMPQTSTGPTLDEIYKNIQLQKQKAGESGSPGSQPSGIRPGPSALPCIPSLDTMYQPHAGPSVQLHADQSFMSRVFRTTTMEEFDALIGDNDDLLFDLVEGLPLDQQRMIEDIKAEGGEDAAPRNVKALIRTFTLERILSQNPDGQGPANLFRGESSLWGRQRDEADFHGSLRSPKRSRLVNGSLPSFTRARPGERLPMGMPGNGPLRTRSQLQELADAAAALEEAERQSAQDLHHHQQQQQQQQQQAIAQAHAQGQQQQQQQHQMDLQMVMTLTREAERLAADNGAMQSHLELLLRHLEGVHQENQAMKALLLQMCNVNGINADMQQLDQTIAMHQPPQVPDDQAALFAASILSHNKGSVGSTIQELLHTAISQSRLGSVVAAGPSSAPLPPAPSQSHRQQHMQIEQSQVWQTPSGMFALNGGAPVAVAGLNRQSSLNALQLQAMLQQPQHQLSTGAILNIGSGSALHVPEGLPQHQQYSIGPGSLPFGISGGGGGNGGGGNSGNAGGVRGGGLVSLPVGLMQLGQDTLSGLQLLQQ